MLCFPFLLGVQIMGRDVQVEEDSTVRGISFVVDWRGRRRAVIIDLEVLGDLWEDFFDVVVSESRRGEPTISWEELKSEMQQEERKKRENSK